MNWIQGLSKAIDYIEKHLTDDICIDSVTIQGGFDMSQKYFNEFHLVDWSEIDGQQGEELSAADKYNRIVGWAGKARGKNPSVFDALTEWILDDSQWTDDKLAENEQILMQGVFARFKEQNARLRMYLKELEPSDVVNEPVFKALDDFDRDLEAFYRKHDTQLSEAVANVFADFSLMRERSIREK